MRLPNTINQHTAKTPVNSALSVVIRADAYPSAKLYIGKTRTEGFYTGISGLYSPDGNEWEFYVPPYFFPDGGKTHYKIAGTDSQGNRVLVASGRLFVVYEGGAEPDSQGSRSEAFVLGSDGWHRLRVAVDDAGRLAFTVEQFPREGDDEHETPYAFNTETGRFHPLSAFRDDAGQVMVAMGDPDGGGASSFSLDPDTNVWYNIETDGVNMAVGEAQ